MLTEEHVEQLSSGQWSAKEEGKKKVLFSCSTGSLNGHKLANHSNQVGQTE